MSFKKALLTIFGDILSFLRKPESWLGILAIIIAIVLGYRSLTTGQLIDYMQAILAVLGALSLALSVTHFSSTSRDKKIDAIAETLKSPKIGQYSADAFFTTRKNLIDMETYITSTTKSLDIACPSLSNVATGHQGALEFLKQNGVRIRLIVSNPENTNLQEAIALKFYEARSAELHSQLVRTVLGLLKRSVGQSPSGGSLEIRVSDIFPSYGYWGKDTSISTGLIRVEMYQTQTPIAEDRILVLHSTQDPILFSIYQNQFEILWKESKYPYGS